MGYIEEIRKLSGSELMFTLLFISGAICPGTLVIWNFSPELIKDYGIFTILILSVGFMLPVIAINSLGMIFMTSNRSSAAHERASYCIGFASGISMIIVAIPLLICFLASLCLRQFVWIVLVCEFLFILLCVLHDKFNQKDKEESHQRVT